jgi:hypothetical protein
MKRICIVLWMTVFIQPGCRRELNPLIPRYEIDMKIAKWFDNHTAALTMTFDNSSPPSAEFVSKILIENGLRIDYEIVAYNYVRYSYLLDYLKKYLLPEGFGYFGHGYYHYYSDTCTYQEAYENFKHCFDQMQLWGLKTAAYAYPHGAGNEFQTRMALRDAGFLGGRMHHDMPGGYEGMENPYIVPDDVKEPIDWFALPTVVMQDYEFSPCKKCVSNDEQLIPFLEQAVKKTAWIMMTYHSIGIEDGYGFYKLSEFDKDLQSIKKYNFWNPTMNQAILYIRERKDATVATKMEKDDNGNLKAIQITLSDGLPNDMYDQPLTLDFNIPKEWIGKTIHQFQGDNPVQSLKFDSEKTMVSALPNESSFILRVQE